MNKQEWLQIKTSQQMSVELFYEYYKIHNKKDTVMEPQEFTNNFQIYVHHIRIIPTKRIIEYFDQKLQITKLMDRLGKIIKEY